MTEFSDPNCRILASDLIKEYGHNYNYSLRVAGSGRMCSILITESIGKPKSAVHGSFKNALEAGLEEFRASDFENYDIDPTSLPRQIDMPIVLKKGDPVFLVTKNGLEIDKVKDIGLVEADGDMGRDLASSGLTHLPTYVLESGKTITPPARRLNPLSMEDFAEITVRPSQLAGQDRTVDYPLRAEDDLKFDRAFFSSEAAQTWARSQAAEMQRIADGFARQARMLGQTAFEAGRLNLPDGPQVIEL